MYTNSNTTKIIISNHYKLPRNIIVLSEKKILEI